MIEKADIGQRVRLTRNIGGLSTNEKWYGAGSLGTVVGRYYDGIYVDFDKCSHHDCERATSKSANYCTTLWDGTVEIVSRIPPRFRRIIA